MNTVSDIIAETLVAAGLDTVFGLPGGENVPLMAALQRYGFRFVLARNENSAVFMADSYARQTGRPGVCLTTLGPGVANAAAGLGHAFLDRAPLVYISAMMDEALVPHHTHQYFDQAAFVTPLTKKTVVMTAENAGEAVAEALVLCQSGRPGPVHLQISRRSAGQPAGGRSAAFPVQEQTEPSRAELEQACELLQRAQRPLIIAGLGLEPQRPYGQLRALAEHLQAPVITTPKAKGALPADHSLMAGTIGLTATDPVYELVGEADCILAAGFDPVELVRPWTETAQLIWAAPWANEDPRLPAEFELVGSLPTIFSDLRSGITVGKEKQGWGSGRVAKFKARLAAIPLPPAAAGRLQPQVVLEALAAVLPPETVVTVDVGAHKILASLDWPAQQPNTFLLSNGLSSMGFGLPAAIGASLARVGRPVTAIHGDGGLAMVCGELGLVSELGLPVIVVVMNDGALDLIRAAQGRAGEAVFGTTFGVTDWVKVADGFGVDGVRLSSAADIQVAVAGALSQARPLLIDALIDPVSYPTSPK